MKVRQVRRGEVYYCDLSPVIGSEQGGLRPCLIIQNDVGNIHSPTTIVAPLTSQFKTLITHINVSKEQSGLSGNSQALLEHIRTVDKRRLLEYKGKLPDEVMTAINRAIKISLGVD